MGRPCPFRAFLGTRGTDRDPPRESSEATARPCETRAKDAPPCLIYPNPCSAKSSWAEGLRPGDTVRFRFPIAEEDGAKPKRRPCLVLETGELNGRRSVTLAYGTGAPARGKYGYEVIVKAKAAMTAAGLTKPTRFVCIRRITVSTEHPGFEAARGSDTPVIGRLDAPLLQRMDNVRARLWAEHDMAAERRHERDLERRRWQREERRIRIENRARHAAEA